jgi:hypothetical protein
VATLRSQVDGRPDAGDAVLLRASTSGLTGKNAQSFSQNTSGVPGTAEENDAFGSQVRLLDINGNGRADLAATAIREDSVNGAVWVLRGTKTGLTADAASPLAERRSAPSTPRHGSATPPDERIVACPDASARHSRH